MEYIAFDAHKRYTLASVARHLAEATYWMLSKKECYREPKGSGRFVHRG